MRSFKAMGRLDRQTYWMWVVPLIVAQVVLTQLPIQSLGALRGLGVVTVLWLARTVGGRFDDIGWRPWIGISFILVTMIALPLVALAVAIAIKLQPSEMPIVLGMVALTSGVLNLVLIVVAGSMPGTDRLDKLIAPFDEPENQTSGLTPQIDSPIAGPPVEPSGRLNTAAAMPLVIGSVCVAIATLCAVVVHSLFIAPAPSVVSRAQPSARPDVTTRPSTGSAPASASLDRQTSDFLRQLSAKGVPGGTAKRPPADNSIWPGPSKVLPQQKAAP